MNVTAHYYDGSTETTFIAAGTIGAVGIAVGVENCGTYGNCVPYVTQFSHAVVTPTGGQTIRECCI
jgi:hypothetical protein